MPLGTKHNFHLGTLGIILGMLQDGLTGGRGPGIGPCLGLLTVHSRGGALSSACACHLLSRHRCCAALASPLVPPPPSRRAGHHALQRPVRRRLPAEHHRHVQVGRARPAHHSSRRRAAKSLAGQQHSCCRVQAPAPPSPPTVHRARSHPPLLTASAVRPNLRRRGLRSLTLDDVQCRIYKESLAELGRLTALTQLTLSATQRHGVFIYG